MSKFGYNVRYENLAKELIHHILGFKVISNILDQF